MRTVLVEHELVVGELVLREVDRVPRHKPGVNPDVAALVIAMRSHHEVVPVSRDLPSIELMDHDDLPVPASALDGEVDVIVTGDRALVDLGAVEGIRIRSPRAFWAVLSR